MLMLSTVRHVILVADPGVVSEKNIFGVTLLESREGIDPRDVGLEYWHGHPEIYFNEPVIFLDDECIPQIELPAAHLKILSHPIPVISCGRILEEKYGWKDSREINASTSYLFSGSGALLQNNSMVKNGLAIFGSNMGMNHNAYLRLRELMQRYYGSSRIFIDGLTPCDSDAFLGYAAWGSRVFIQFIRRGDNAVKRVAMTQKDTYPDKLSAAVKDLGAKLVNQPLGLEFYESF